MGKGLMAAISLAVFAVLALAAWRAWQRRIKDQQSIISEPLEALEYFGELISASTGFYVATTFARDHLQRIAAYGLGARGVCQVMVFSEGVLIVRTGERPLALDKSSIQQVSTGQVAIDKVVEPGGLVVIDWSNAGTELSTHIRIVEAPKRKEIISAISNIAIGAQKEKETK